jgi:HK97 family phage major capsid protein
MAVFGTGALQNLPRNIADGLVRKTQSGSTVAALSGREAQRFGSTDIITFNDLPRAEFVEEGADKASTTGSFGVVTATPHKAQVTMRFNQEVLWADEDYQLGVLDTLADAGATALSRALDLGLYYRINPLTGNAITGWTNYLNATTKRVETTATSEADADVESAVGLVLSDGFAVNGVAMDPSYSWTLATARYGDGRKKFPELGFGTNIQNFQGLNVAVSDTVSARPETAGNNVKAILGDFQGGIRWGVQRDLPLELIQFGDPDGQGDLKRKNQIALRLEVVYGWYVFTDRFVVIENAVADA